MTSKEKGKKTVFILINRSFIIRNILRSGALRGLKESGHIIHVFFDAPTIPQYLRDEFEDEQVHLHATKVNRRGILRRFDRLKNYLALTNNTKLYYNYHGKSVRVEKLDSGILSRNKKPRLLVYFEFALAHVLSRLSFAKWLFRFIERVVFPQFDERVEDAFQELKPDVIFSTSINGTLESVFLKAARRRNVPTISMMKSWDNISNQYLPVTSDYFLAQNNTTRKYAISLQGIPREKIAIVGLPQFDWYRKPDVIVSREEHFTKKGLDINRALIFFGSEGAWALNDWDIAEELYTWVLKDAFVKPCQLLVRPHYSDISNKRLEFFRNKPLVVVDDYKKVDFLIDKWDPSEEEIKDFTNSVAHCDVLVNVASTLSLDAACLDRPIINVAYGCEYIEGKDITDKKLYGTDHIRWLMERGGGEKVRSSKELKGAVNAYLLDPSLKSEGRKRLRDELCYKVDGKSSERIVEEINAVLRGSEHSLL